MNLRRKLVNETKKFAFDTYITDEENKDNDTSQSHIIHKNYVSLISFNWCGIRVMFLLSQPFNLIAFFEL